MFTISVRVDVVIDVLADVWAGVIIDGVSAINIDMFPGENAAGLTAVMTPSEFTLPALCEEALLLCSAAVAMAAVVIAL